MIRRRAKRWQAHIGQVNQEWLYEYEKGYNLSIKAISKGKDGHYIIMKDAVMINVRVKLENPYIVAKDKN